MKKIAVFTSGGDSSGMNACIRAVVRTAMYNKIEVFGIRRGYEGMIDDDFIPLYAKSVSNILQRGGTILKSARSERFRTAEGMQKAKENLIKNAIDGVVVIGGDGSFKGALDFGKICNVPFVGCPGTIDNDLFGTDFTIGYDTAINNVIEAVDKIRETAESHDRIFVVEVMGRDAGLIALRSGIGSGAEAILIPEQKNELEKLFLRIKQGRKDKTSKVIMVAEGDESGGAINVAKLIQDKFPKLDVKVTILGHVQRGGSPSCMERVNASRIGFAAVEGLLEGKSSVMTGIVNGNIVFTPFEKAVKHICELNPQLVKMMQILSA